MAAAIIASFTRSVNLSSLRCRRVFGNCCISTFGRSMSIRSPLCPIGPCIIYHKSTRVNTRAGFYLLNQLEAWAGIAPAHRSFADSRLTAWLPGRKYIPLDYTPTFYSTIAFPCLLHFLTPSQLNFKILSFQQRPLG